MSLSTNLVRRGSTYYFRVSVPRRFRLLIGRAELWRSLRTTDKGEARRRAAIVWHLTERLWRDVQRCMDLSTIERVDRDLAQALVDRWLRAEITEDAYLRAGALNDPYPGAILRREAAHLPDTLVRVLDHEALGAFEDSALGPNEYLVRDTTERDIRKAGQRKVFADAVARHETEEENIAVEHVRTLFERHGRPVDIFSGTFETATLLMMKAHRDLLRVIESRDGENWRPLLDDDPAQALVETLELRIASRPLEAARPKHAVKVFSVAASEALKALTVKESFPPKRVEDYENAVRAFLGFLEGDPDFRTIDAKTMGEFMRALERYPTNASKREPYRDLRTFSERLKTADERGEIDRLSPVTINGKYLTPLRRVYEWHKGGDPSLVNPLAEVRAEKPRKADPSTKRRNFSDAEVCRLLALPLFIGAAGMSGAQLYLPGPHRVSDWRFWVPLICLFSGMRLNEACGLAVADIRDADGIHFFHVRDDTKGQSLKSDAARRRVPIHSLVLEVGFLNFVEQMKEGGRERLFEELTLDVNGYFSTGASKFFADLRKRYIDPHPEEPGRLTFHSARHTVITKLRSAGVRQDVATELVGHEQDQVHAGYGSYGLTALRDAVETILYPGLDIDPLIQPKAALIPPLRTLPMCSNL